MPKGPKPLLIAQKINDFITERCPAALRDKSIADGIGLTDKAAHPAQIK
jgi:hypothetical protein